MKLVMATSLLARMTGLLNRRRCTNGEVLLLVPCKSIHSFGMRQPIDVAFLDEEALVLVSERAVPAGSLRSCAGAVAVMERRSCTEQYWPRAGEHVQLTVNQRR